MIRDISRTPLSSRLSEQLHIRPGYLRAINVEQHADHVEHYIPTGRALDVIGRLVRTVQGETAGHAWSLTGPYGAGKSSFAVFLRALLGPDGSARDTADLLLAAASPHLGRDLVAARARTGADRRGFILAATTCQPEPAIDSLLRSLEHGTRSYWPGRRPAEVSQVLARAHAARTSREITDAVATISERAPVLILLDEFGKTLEHFTTHAALNTEADLFVLQEIAELATDHDHPVLMLTLQHLAFDDYVRAASITQRREWGKIAGRFEDVPFLESSEQSLRLIAGAVTDDPNIAAELVEQREAWASGAHTQLVRLGLDARLPGGADTLAAAYPLHPTALLALPDLCAKLGQHGRTLFSFLASTESHTLGAYLADTTWITTSDTTGDRELSRSDGASLSLPELRLSDVFDFFTGPGRALTAAAGQRWMEIDTRIREATGLERADLDCLKVVGLLNLLADATGVRASAALVCYALSRADGPGDPAWRSRLEDLESRGWLTYRSFADEYRLWQGTDVDLRARVADAREQLRSTSPAALLATLYAGAPAIAGKHTQRVGMLRYFVPSFADPTQRALPALAADDPADGQLIYYLGPPTHALDLTLSVTTSRPPRPPQGDDAAGSSGSGAPRTVAHQFARPVVMAVSDNADRVIDAAIEAAAALAVLDQHDVASDRVARRELQDRAADARRRLSGALEEAFRPGAPRVAYLRATDHATAEAASGTEHGQAAGGARLGAELGNERWARLSVTAGLSRLLSDVCETAYCSSPEIRNEMLGRRELTSQGAKARRELLDAMATRGHLERLGIVGYGPERAMYEAVLADTGMHSLEHGADGQSWGFGPPAIGSTLNHAWGTLTLAAGTGRTVSVAELYGALKAPPIGLKDGPIPVLLTAWLLHRADDLAVYEDGTYQPTLTADLLERLVKTPHRFAVKEFDLAGPRAKVLSAILDAADLAPARRISGRNTTVLRAAAPLLSRVRALPKFTRTTRKALSSDAERVRDALLKAREPDVLLFETLPQACGLQPIPARRPRDKQAQESIDSLVEDYARRLAAALADLDGALDAVLAECADAMSDEFTLREPVSELREDLRVRARALAPGVIEPRLRAFCNTATIDADKLDDSSWLEAVALTVTGRPPSAWSDDDQARFHLNLHEIAATFRRVEALHLEAAARAHDGFTARRIAITEPDGTERTDVVWLDHSAATAVNEFAAEVLEKAVDRLGPNGPRALLAALADQALDQSSRAVRADQAGSARSTQPADLRESTLSVGVDTRAGSRAGANVRGKDGDHHDAGVSDTAPAARKARRRSR